MDADPEAELDAQLRLHPGGMVTEDPLHPKRTPERALGVILVGDGRAKDHEDRVADELLDGPVVTERLLGEVLEDPRHEHLQLLRVEIVGDRGEADEVGEEDRDKPSLLVRGPHIESKYRWPVARAPRSQKRQNGELA